MLVNNIFFFPFFIIDLRKISAFLFFPKEIIFKFLNFAFFSKKLKNLSSRFNINVPPSIILLIISPFAFAIPVRFLKFSIWASPIFVIIPI